MTDFLADGRIMILDGATGTMIQKCGLAEEDFRAGIPDAPQGKELKGNNECLNLSRPDIIRKIHNEYMRGLPERLLMLQWILSARPEKRKEAPERFSWPGA